MRLSRTLPLALATTLLAGVALAAPELTPTTAPTSISGKVDALFGHQIVVATDNGGKVLVDVGRPSVQPPITVGEKLQIAGQVEGSRLEARSMTRADGSAVVLHEAGREHRERHQEADAIGRND